ncbi:hypothetical protein TNIN_239831, partial [Trichonephila inaurata madagascariensis]
MATTSAADGR